MGSITNWLENELLDHVCNAAFSPTGTLVLALCTSDPGETATGASMNEVANSGNYARATIDFLAASSRVVDQNGSVDFNQASGSWGTVTHWAVVDNATYGSGNVYAYGALNTSKSIVAGNTPSVANGEIDVTFSANEVSNYLANALLDLAFNNSAFSAPDTYAALVHTDTIDDTDTGSTITEVSGGSYARVQINVNGGSSPTWDVAASGALANTHEVAFPQATASWGTVIALAICDASSGGNLLFYDNGVTDQLVDNGDTAKFPIGDIDITLD